VAPLANDLLKIALDDTLPHLLIRAFAKSALDQLLKSGTSLWRLRNSSPCRQSMSVRFAEKRLMRVGLAAIST